jgi:hypothetical protein
MKAMSSRTPGVNFTAVECGAIAAASNPAATLARALISSLANSIGRVNVIAAATLAYAGHDRRMMTPRHAHQRYPGRQPSDDSEDPLRHFRTLSNPQSDRRRND